MNGHMNEINNGDINSNDIVISGIAGRFPESDNFDEFKQKLFDGVDLLSDDNRRWPAGLFGLPKRSGKLKNLEHFDATFFGMSPKQAHKVDPQIRFLLETTFEALLDAGVNPNELKGTRTGVFIGLTENESAEFFNRDVDAIDGYGVLGTARTMFANRISYAFDLKGPSYTIDTACSSSLSALHMAVAAIQAHECDTAIVGASHINIQPEFALHLSRLNMLSEDGKCKAFDASADGYARSEGVGIVFIQRAKSARRIYATILGTKTYADGYKEEGIAFPSGKVQGDYVQKLYEEVEVDPSDVTYVEAHATGTQAGDVQETNAIARVFCKNRKQPLLIGSIKSNIGHAEAAAGICSLAKIIMAMETGTIPQNLHYKSPNPDIPSLIDGRLKVVSKNQTLPKGLVAINSFGFGGMNAHLILQPHTKPKQKYHPEHIPRLVAVSGCTNESVSYMLAEAEKYKHDTEFLALLHKVYTGNIAGHNYRGYSILGEDVQDVVEIKVAKRPVWFVYSGMGSQYPGVAKHLMQMDVFKNTMKNISNLSFPCGLNINNLIMNSDEITLKNVQNAFVYITAIQIALTDVLTKLGIRPDGIIGHSVGEIGCSYADQGLTIAEAIMVSYYRGAAFLESQLEAGAMASVGLTVEECATRCPPEIFIACHNSKNNVTVSGTPKAIQKFVEQLKSENIFAKVINSSGQAFHSKYCAAVAPILKRSLDKLITHAKPRTSKWISSSIPQTAWNTSLAERCSSEYFVNNTISPVLFYEAIQHIPDDAIVVEIAPHCLLRSLLKRDLASTVTYCGLLKHDHPNNLNFLLSNIGLLYNAGCHPQIDQLYHPVSFPVGRSTPGISSMVKWNHSTEWDVPDFTKHDGAGSKHIITMDLSKEEYRYLLGHVVEGNKILTVSFYLSCVWKTFANIKNKNFENVSVLFENVQFYGIVPLSENTNVKFAISIFEESGNFLISEADTVLVSGKVSIANELDNHMCTFPQSSTKDNFILRTNDVYKELHLRGIDYSGPFCGVVQCNYHGTKGKLKWLQNWITFMDTMIHFFILGKSNKERCLLAEIQKVYINPMMHAKKILELPKNNDLEVLASHALGVVQSGGIQIQGLKTNLIQPNSIYPEPTLETYQFIPLNRIITISDQTKSQMEALSIATNIILENLGGICDIKVVEFPGPSCLAPLVKGILEKEPKTLVEYVVVNNNGLDPDALTSAGLQCTTNDTFDQNMDILVLSNILKQPHVLEGAVASLKGSNGCLLLEEDGLLDCNQIHVNNAEVLCIQTAVSACKTYIVLRNATQLPTASHMIHITDSNFHWIQPLKAALRNSEKDNTLVYLVAHGEATNGIMGLVNCLKKEPGGTNIRSYFIQNHNAELFSLSSHCYAPQIKKDLVHNVLDKNNVWGTYRYLPIHPNNTENGQVKHAFVKTLAKGQLSSLRWIKASLPFLHNNNDKYKELCTVYYTALNLRDIMLAAGKLPVGGLPKSLAGEEKVLGFEFSGRSSTGKRVMGIVDKGGLATSCSADQEFLWKVPEKWSLKEAATVPFAYLMSYYAMIIRGCLLSGETVLIHNGISDIAFAAISIAINMKCVVFVSTNSAHEKTSLKQAFPEIQDNHIQIVNEPEYEHDFMIKTNGHGVDLCINLLNAQQVQTLVRCLANEGRFVQIGKEEVLQNTVLKRNFFLKEMSYHEVSLDSLWSINAAVKKKLGELVYNGIQNNVVKPLPTAIFAKNDLERAFKCDLSQSNALKVLAEICNEELRGTLMPLQQTTAAILRTYFPPHKSYILVGGLGGFGLELANWLIQRGATKIVLSSRTGIKSGYQSLCIRRWRDQNITVTVSTADVTTPQGAVNLIKDASGLGPVGGVFNMALVLRDALFENQTKDDFLEVTRSKVDTTQNLDAATRQLVPDLDYFVSFSSFSCGRGNAGQSNYGYANSALERICEVRHSEGLPSLAIQWSTIGDVGASHESGINNQITLGVDPQGIVSCLDTLDMFLQLKHPTVSSFVIAKRQKNKVNVDSSSITDVIGQILGITNVEKVSQTATLSELGMDSLMGAEIKQTLSRHIKQALSLQEIRSMTFDTLTKFSSGKEEKVTSNTDNMFNLSEKIAPSNVVIFKMPTKNHADQKPVFFIHSVESDEVALRALADLAEIPVYSLQFKYSCLNSIRKLAKDYVNQIQTIQPKGPYVIIEYSSCAKIALEVGVQLEECGNSVKILLIEKLQNTNNGFRSNEAYNESLMLAYLSSLVKGLKQFVEIDKLVALETFDERVTLVSKVVSDNTTYDPAHVKASFVSVYPQIKTLLRHSLPKPFKGEVTIIKSQNKHTLEQDLSSVCSQPVKVYQLDENNKPNLETPAVARIATILNCLASTPQLLTNVSAIS